MTQDKLTDKQQRFCLEYLKDSNATAAAARAGYSEKNADKIGSQLLGKTRVSAEISRLQAEMAEATGIQVADLVKELAKVAFTNLPDLLEASSFEKGAELEIKDLSEMTEAQRASILEISETKGKQGTTRRIKLHNKLAAIDMLMKNLGGYVTASDLVDRLPEERLNQLLGDIIQKISR